MKKVYFPNLNGIRFIAAFLVVIHHIEQLKNIYHLPNHWGNKTVGIIGGLGVTLFFVLSGFLITYMLFVEKSHVGTIDVKDFYIRRILRIWPLYFFIVILAFFVLPDFHQLDVPRLSQYIPYDFTNKLILFAVFLPNAALLLYPPVPFASQLWSIGVEEQFYLIWPVLIKFFKKPVFLLGSVVVIYWLLKIILHNVLQNQETGSLHDKTLFMNGFIEFTRINCMAIGGFGAYFLYTKNDYFLKFFYSNIVQVIVYFAVFILIGFGINIPYLNDEVYSLLFMIIIVNLASNKMTVISINNAIFDYLGKISYGLYMYHPLAIIIAIVLVIETTVGTAIYAYNNYLIYFFSIATTIFISAVSYELFEKFFIKKKVFFSRIISGENARSEEHCPK